MSVLQHHFILLKYSPWLNYKINWFLYKMQEEKTNIYNLMYQTTCSHQANANNDLWIHTTYHWKYISINFPQLIFRDDSVSTFLMDEILEHEYLRISKFVSHAASVPGNWANIFSLTLKYYQMRIILLSNIWLPFEIQYYEHPTLPQCQRDSILLLYIHLVHNSIESILKLLNFQSK